MKIKGILLAASLMVAQAAGAQTAAPADPTATPSATQQQTGPTPEGVAPAQAVVAVPAPGAPTATAQPTPAPASPAEANAPAQANAGAKGSYVPMKPDPTVGQPIPGGIDFQPQVTKNGEYAYWLSTYILLPLMVVISLIVLALLLWVMARYRKGANPNPSKTSHNTLVEVLWTVIPIFILLAVAVPSIKLIAKQYQPAPKDAVTIKVTGYQWYWGYQYPDHGGFELISKMLTDEQAKANGEPTHLAVDNRMVIPVGKPVKLLVTGADVIHSFAVPAFWTKIDAVPGRINEVTFTVDKPGVYYGQCSELCGVDHGYMPIAVEALPQDKFEQWVAFNGGAMPGAAAAEAAAPAAAPAADAKAASAADTKAAAPAAADTKTEAAAAPAEKAAAPAAK